MTVLLRQLHVTIPAAAVLIVSVTFFSSVYAANDYTNSAHGNASTGVNRTSMSGYSPGNCGHCHEQHGTIEAAASGPYEYALFYNNYVSLTPPDSLCFKCHDGTTDPHDSTINNYSYSSRAGNYWPVAGNPPDNIEAFFTISPPDVTSYHNLDNIKTFLTTNPGASGWGYTSDPNPCIACHDPHAAQGDPEGDNPPTPSAKSSGSRGALLSRPSQYSILPRPLWGDNSTTESMWAFATTKYQAPYRYNVTTAYEPQGDSTATPQQTVARNTTDFPTFCTDCHDDTNVIASSTLSPSLLYIIWSGQPSTEKHGLGDADGFVCLDAPYDPGSPYTPQQHVLSCMDCHESHGSANAYILRSEVNGKVLGGPLSVSTILTRPSPGPPNTASWPSPSGPGNQSWEYLCNNCHKDDFDINPACNQNTWYYAHHPTGPLAGNCYADPPYNATGGCGVGSCHSSSVGPLSCTATVTPIACDACHFHGSTDAAISATGRTPTGRKTF